MKAFTEATNKPPLRLLHGGIRSRLFLLVFLIMLPFAVLFGFIYHQRYETRRHQALQAELEVARGLVVTFNNYLTGLRKQSLALGHAIAALPASEKAQVTALLSTALRFSQSARSISWLSPGGVVEASSEESLIGIDLSERSSFRQAIAGKDLAIGNLAPTGAVTPRPTLTVSIAIRNARGEVSGVMMTAIEPTRLQEFALTQQRPGRGALAIFDGNGTLVYHSLLKTPSWEERISWRRGDRILTDVLRTRREKAGIQLITHLNNEKWVSARVPVPGTSFVVGAGRPVEAAFRDVWAGMLNDALLGVIVFALAFCTAALVGRSISRPVLRLEADARLLGEGKAVEEDPWAPTEVQILRGAMVSMSSALLRRSRELEESETSLRTVFDNVYDGIVIHDELGRIIAVNQRWLEMARTTREKAAGLTIADASAGRLRYEEVLPMWQKVLAGETMMLEWRARRAGSGEEFDAEIFLCSIRFNSMDLIMANVRDITERKQVAAELHRSRDELELRVQERTADLAKAFADLEAETERRVAAVEEVRAKEQLIIQQSRLAAMGEMMGKIAHHWRQPLNIIGLMVQDLLLSAQMETLSVPDMEDHTYRIMSVLDRLSRSIDDFHNLFSPDTSRTAFVAEEVIETALSLLRDELEHVKVQVTRSCREGSTIDGFRNQYLQVILNILANAREILQERNVPSPCIHIAIACQSGRSIVTISDNGGGVDPEIMEKIFDPYFSTRSREKAAGIGLFMAKMIIEKNMGGTLSVRNIADGAEFSVVV